MKSIKSSALLIGLLSSFGNIWCASVHYFGCSHPSSLRYAETGEQSRSMPRTMPKVTAAEQVLAMGLMRQMYKRVRVAPLILDTRGEVPQSCILRMNDTGRCSLYYQNQGFLSGDESGMRPVFKENVDDVLSQLDCKTMGNFLALNKICMSKGSDQEMILRAMMMGHGGIGPRFAGFCERWAGYALTFLCMRSVSKGIEKLPEFINGVARGVGSDGSVLNRVATAAEMIAAGYKEVAPGKWTLIKVLEKRIPDDVKNATVYTLYDAMPDYLKEAFKADQQAALYKMGQAIGTTIQNSSAKAMDFVGRACEIAGFHQEPIYYFENGVIKKAAEKVAGGLTVAKDAFETATGTSILSQTAKGMIKDMVIEGLGGAALSIGIDLVGGAIGYYFDSTHLSTRASIVGGTAITMLSGEGTTVDAIVDKGGLAIVAAEGFGKATGNYILRILPCESNSASYTLGETRDILV